MPLRRTLILAHLRAALAASFFMSLAPALAFAADEAHGGHAAAGPIPAVNEGIVTALAAIVVFGVCAVVLGAKVWPTIAKGLAERADKIRNEIEAAELAQQQAKAALQQYEQSLAQARAQAQKMLDDTKTQQAALAAELRAKSEIELTQLREKAKRDIETAKRAAVAEIHEHATMLATQIAGKILQREIGPQDQARLVSESLRELQGIGHN